MVALTELVLQVLIPQYRPSDELREQRDEGGKVDEFCVRRRIAAMHIDQIAERLKDVIPMHMFKIAIQAKVGSEVVARENVRALRKDVTAKCYGGDISRKRKLLEKQKKGKKRMRQVGNVEIPQQAFMAVLKLND